MGDGGARPVRARTPNVRNLDFGGDTLESRARAEQERSDRARRSAHSAAMADARSAQSDDARDYHRERDRSGHDVRRGRLTDAEAAAIRSRNAAQHRSQRRSRSHSLSRARSAVLASLADGSVDRADPTPEVLAEFEHHPLAAQLRLAEGTGLNLCNRPTMDVPLNVAAVTPAELSARMAAFEKDCGPDVPCTACCSCGEMEIGGTLRCLPVSSLERLRISQQVRARQVGRV